MKKNIFFTIVAVIALVNLSYAQHSKFSYPINKVYKNNLPVIEITSDVNLHFRTPEPVQFVDLSTDILIGDLPTDNVVRVKIQEIEEEKTFVNDTLRKVLDIKIPYTDQQELGIVTIVGQSFMAQYKLVFRDKQYSSNVLTNIEIQPNEMQPLEYPNYEFSNMELKQFSIQLIQKKQGKAIRKEKDLKMMSTLNAVYTMGDLVFLDITFSNKTNLSYDIDQLSFSIDDKKIYKSTNVQSIEIEPIYKLYGNKKFKKNFRNIYVFKKFTYPNNKVLNVRLIENQISGRTINLQIKYSDILQADTF